MRIEAAEGHQQGQLHRSTGLSQQFSPMPPLHPGQVAQNPQGPILQLAVGYSHIHHPVAVHLAQPHHHPGGEDVEGHLGGGAGLEAGGAGEQFRSSQQTNVDVAGHGRLLGGHTGQGDGQGSDAAGMAESPEHIGGCAPRRDAHQGIGRSEAALLQVGRACIKKIFQALRTSQQCGGPTGQHPLHQLGRCAEGGGAFGRIQHTQAPGGASAKIKEPPTGAQPLGDRIHRRSEARGCLGHSALGLQFVLTEQGHQSSGLEFVEGFTGGIGLFSEQMAAIEGLGWGAHSRPSRRRRKASSSGSPTDGEASAAVLAASAASCSCH